MSWNEHTRELLETRVFKGKIVDRRKGRGGLVYIIEQDAHPKYIAYKTIQELESNLSIDTERIDREARNWFSFAGHPLVINPYFTETWDGIPLICMPYCDGDLRKLISSELESKKLSLTSVVCLSLQIVKGMIVANRRGMVHHQDIKPENLLYIDLSKKFCDFPPSHVDLSLRYSVRIADFGVANAWSDNHLGGTNAYKAPEQYDPSPYKTFAPDVFAVGVVIAELFQGYHPATKNSATKVWKWRGSKLKKWSIDGERHFSPSQNPQAQELVLLAKAMLAADPDKRPSFQQCYDRLASILNVLSSNSLKQLELLFDYFDYISNYCELPTEIDRYLKLAEIPSQRDFVKERIKARLRNTLDGDMTSLESVIRVHHLAKAFYQMCGEECIHQDRELLVEASSKVVKFVLRYHANITADHLWPRFSFGEPNPKKHVTDIEAKAEILNTSIERLQIVGLYDEQLKEQVEEGGNVIRACRILNVASKLWLEGRRAEACDLLHQVRQLAPQEPELENLYKFWTTVRDLTKQIHQR
ncbi:MAG: protein kinase [Cyanobacteriota bacterium]|nr:protein kinase [Cyanobacteriota bacterium]